MAKYRINVKGVPPHLQEKWSKTLSERFNRYMDERAKLSQAQERLRASRRQEILDQIFPKSK